MSIQKLAADYLEQYMRQTGAELVQVVCHVDKQAQIPTQADVRAFLESAHVQSRFDCTDVTVLPGELESINVPEPISEHIEIDHEPEPGLILVRRTKHGLAVFIGNRRRDGYPLFSFNKNLAHVFQSEEEILNVAFAGEDLQIKSEFAGVEVWPAPTPRSK